MKIFKKIINKFDREYHKNLLSFIIFNSVAMMWCSYILAWFGKNEIAEALSKTIVTAIIGVVIPYLITKTIENINKYGSRLNNTVQDNVNVVQNEDENNNGL